MIYIGTTNDNGSAIYFDIHATERLGRNVCISGTLGDGSYEGEVLVELGRTESVTFADAWLGGYGFNDFVSRCDMASLESSLLESMRNMSVFSPRRTQPHGVGRCSGETAVAEAATFWHVCS